MFAATLLAIGGKLVYVAAIGLLHRGAVPSRCVARAAIATAGSSGSSSAGRVRDTQAAR